MLQSSKVSKPNSPAAFAAASDRWAGGLGYCGPNNLAGMSKWASAGLVFPSQIMGATGIVHWAHIHYIYIMIKV